jgi:DNA replication licensing factor MCM7
MDAVK